VGPFKNGGREYQPVGEPEQVNVHDFVDPEVGKAIPYDIYDVSANTGWVSVGTEHDTSAFARLWNSLVDAGDPGLEILHAYTVKENLRQLLALAGTNPDREAISHRLWRFYDQAASSTSPEVHRLAATIEAWWPAVEPAITTDYSNARSEGYNRLAKHQGRNAFGFRSVDNQRRRIRWACNRQHRRATATTNEMPAQV